MTVPGKDQGPILAAGGVVTRRNGRSREFLVIHRPQYDDWSLPKGKLEYGERFSAAAAREIEEEAGSKTAQIARLGSVGYNTSESTPKVVRYWLFEHVSGKFSPNDEVDEVRWLRAADALQLLTYPRDRNVFSWGATVVDRPRAGSVFLVRRAKAGERASWAGDDSVRPLTKAGRLQALAVGGALSAWPVGRIATSSDDRCVQTVDPLADAIHERVRKDARLAEGASKNDLLDILAGMDGKTAVLCTHGDEIGRLLDAVAAGGALLDPGPHIESEKASVWKLELAAGKVTAGIYRSPSPP
jgi:8-oxo-dGTP pyrophosphatase MutT (NUDIX family)/phosphohistidine phosphatase SixA